MRAAKQTIKKIVDNEFKMAVAKIKANKQQLTHWCVDANPFLPLFSYSLSPCLLPIIVVSLFVPSASPSLVDCCVEGEQAEREQ